MVKDEATPCSPRPPPQNRRESRNRQRCMISPLRSAPEGRSSRKLQLHLVQANSSLPHRRKAVTFAEALSQVQGYLSETYATLITEDNSDAKEQMKRRMARYLQENRIAVDGMTASELVDALYTEMAEYGFLTKYIFADGIEEIDINSWRDIEIQYSDGHTAKLEEHFDSPEHAANVIRRMLQNSGKVLDNASPIITSRLARNIRISVIKTPVLDEDAGVAASIRIVNPRNLSKADFVQSGTATEEMLDFLSACLRYGVSICVAGATSSGKTTVAGWLLSTIPDRKRIFTIEDGSRELQLIRERDGQGDELCRSHADPRQ